MYKAFKYTLPVAGLALIIMGFATCNDSNDISSKNGKEPNLYLTDYSGEEIKTNIEGVILDVNQNPIQNATVKIGNKSVLTNAKGFYKIEKTKTFKDHSIVKVSKNGYISESSTLESLDSINKVDVSLKKTDEVCLFWFCRYH